MPMLEFRLASATGKRPVFVPGGFGQRAIRALDDLADHIARKHGISRRTAWKWYSRFQRLSFNGLAQVRRADRGQSRFFAGNPLAQRLFTSCLAKGMSTRAIYQVLCWELGDAAPSYGTVRAHVAISQAAAPRRAGHKAVRP